MHSNGSDITVIVQGALTKTTPGTLASIRQHLPGARIILSTWEGSNTHGLDCDQLVLSADPGAFPASDHAGSPPNNINRQIVSTYAGLQQTTTTYAMKLRTDFLLTGAGFLDYWERYPARAPQAQLFQQRLLACCYFTRDPHHAPSFPFHPSDIAFFGLTADLKTLFGIPLMPESEAHWDAATHMPGPRWTNRYAPEQYLILNALRQHGHTIHVAHARDSTPENIQQTDLYLANNFILLGYEQFNLLPTKSVFRLEVHPTTFSCCYTHGDWQKLYQRHSDPTYTPPAIDPERERIRAAYRRYKKYRLLANLVIAPIPGRPRKKRVRHAILDYFLS